MKKTVISYEIDKKIISPDIKYFRGYIAKKYRDSVFHGHNNKNGYVNKFGYYSRMQYKKIGNRLAIVAISDKPKYLEKIYNEVESIKLGFKDYKIISKELKERDEYFSINSLKLYNYKFISPWLPISSKNIDKFKKGELNLNDVLSNHICCTMKNLDFDVTENTIVVQSNLIKIDKGIKFKNVIFHAFYGDFKTNVFIPSLLGVGKAVAFGYGTVLKI